MATRTAATAVNVHLTPDNSGIAFAATRPHRSSEAASRFLQKNHDEHHIFWREVAGHNHVAHSVLSVFALGGNPSELRRAFEDGASIQRPLPPREERAFHNLADPQEFRARMGHLDQYPNFLAFFERQIEEKGWVAVVKEQCFGKTPNSETIFANLLEGLYHPLIHLGLGIEFEQPSIIAEGLAQAASHDSMSIEDFIVDCEQEAHRSTKPKKPLVQLYHDVHSSRALRAAAQGFTDGPSRVRDGILGRSKQVLLDIATQFRVSTTELQRGLAETTNVSAYATGAAKRPGKEHKIDFFHMHGVTSSIFLDVLLRQPWIAVEDKVRLVERKGRVDLLWYAASGAVELNHSAISDYAATLSAGFDWSTLYGAVLKEHDDGHLVKLVRALKHGQDVSRPFEVGDDADAFPIKSNEWLKIAQLGYDSTANRPIEGKWVWGAGFEECWALVPPEIELS